MAHSRDCLLARSPYFENNQLPTLSSAIEGSISTRKHKNVRRRDRSTLVLPPIANLFDGGDCSTFITTEDSPSSDIECYEHVRVVAYARKSK